MPTPAERRALLFFTTVLCLGTGVRAARTLGAREPVPPAAARALEAQQAAVARAQERAQERAQRRAAGRRSAGQRAGRGDGRPPAGASRAAPPRVAPPAAGPVDVDRASAAELEALPRVGPVLARRIVADRDSLGPFGSLAGLGRVRGIGPAMLRGLEGHVTFSGTRRPTSAAGAAPSRRGGR